MRTTTRVAGAAVLLAGWVLLGAGQARAQCAYDTSMPFDGDVLKELPSPMVIKFLIGVHLRAVRLVTADGTTWPVAWSKTDEDVVEVEFRPTQPLPPGQYWIVWGGYVR